MQKTLFLFMKRIQWFRVSSLNLIILNSRIKMLERPSQISSYHVLFTIYLEYQQYQYPDTVVNFFQCGNVSPIHNSHLLERNNFVLILIEMCKLFTLLVCKMRSQISSIGNTKNFQTCTTHAPSHTCWIKFSGWHLSISLLL